MPATLPHLSASELAGYYGPESVTWRIASESALLLGGGRAVLMQLAHPLVAAGVGDHSRYADDPWGRVSRTIQLTTAMTFGTRAEALAAARTINHLHEHVTGTLRQPAGAFGPNRSYHAKDVDLLLWVYATLVDTTLTVYPLLVRAQRERAATLL